MKKLCRDAGLFFIFTANQQYPGAMALMPGRHREVDIPNPDIVGSRPGIFFVMTEDRQQALEYLDQAFSDFIKSYAPATMKDADVHMSTERIFHQIQDIYRSPFYWASDVYERLKERDFICLDITGNGRFEWLLKSL